MPKVIIDGVEYVPKAEIPPVTNSRSEADIPKTTEDFCVNKECIKQRLSFETGEPQTFHEPETPPVLYCEKCGSDYVIDWARMAPLVAPSGASETGQRGGREA
jgi:hypothetical protein